MPSDPRGSRKGANLRWILVIWVLCIALASFATLLVPGVYSWPKTWAIGTGFAAVILLALALVSWADHD